MTDEARVVRLYSSSLHLFFAINSNWQIISAQTQTKMKYRYSYSNSIYFHIL